MRLMFCENGNNESAKDFRAGQPAQSDLGRNLLQSVNLLHIKGPH